MNRNEIQKVVEDINHYVQAQLWLDFEISQYQSGKLNVIGSIDPSSAPDIEICFEDIFFISLPMEWKTDTSASVLVLLERDEAFSINKKFQVEQGYHLFKFIPEYYPDEFGCLIAAKKISFLNKKEQIVYRKETDRI